MCSSDLLEHRNARQYGAVALHEGRIEEIVEKPDTDDYRLINAGVYAFRTEIFDAIEATERREGELQVPDTLARLIDDGEAVRGTRIDGLSPHATYPWDLLTVTREIRTPRTSSPSSIDLASVSVSRSSPSRRSVASIASKIGVRKA